MKKSSSAAARVFAFSALIAALLVLIAVVATSLNSSSTRSGSASAERTAKQQPKKNVPATYVVKNGDTLTSIAHHAGVRVATIMTLNPGLDPQILISGQTIKLR